MTKQDELIRWINDQLEERGWSQAELARRAEVSTGAISELLSAGRTPGEKVLVRIAAAFSVDVESLLAMAGRQGHRSQMTPRLSEMLNLFNMLSDEEQNDELAALRAKVERRRRGKRVKAASAHN